MRRSASVLLLLVGLLLGLAAPSHAWHGRGVRGHVFIGVGPSFWWGPPYPYWYPYYYPPPYVYSPPPVIVQEPPVYAQRPPVPPPAPPAPQSFWYYCSSAGAYYPSVQTCPEAWIKVPPTPQ